jgi:hypothetical protein
MSISIAVLVREFTYNGMALWIPARRSRLTRYAISTPPSIRS